jgi:hypothetical protein
MPPNAVEGPAGVLICGVLVAELAGQKEEEPMGKELAKSGGIIIVRGECMSQSDIAGNGAAPSPPI